MKGKEVSFDEFKEKVKVELVSFTTDADEIESLGAENGIVNMAVGKQEYQGAYDFCVKNQCLGAVMKNVKVEIGLAKNMKMLMNFTKEEKKELWS